MKKKFIFFSTIFFFLTLIAFFNINHQETPTINPAIETAYNATYKMLDSVKEKSDFGMNITGNLIFEVQGNQLAVFDTNMNNIGNISLPFSRSNIIKYKQSSEKNIIYIITIDSENYKKIYSETMLTPKNIYEINLSTFEFKKMVTDSSIVLDIMSQKIENGKIYGKYIKEDKIYYGYLDTTINIFTDIVKLDQINFHDIYYNDQLLAKVQISESGNILVTAPSGTLIYQNRIKVGYTNLYSSLKPFEYTVGDNCIYFLDETKEQFGNLRCFNTLLNKFSSFDYEISAPLHSISYISKNRIKALFYKESNVFHFSEQTFSFDTPTNTRECDSDRITFVESNTENIVLYFQCLETKINIIYEDISQNMSLTLDTQPYLEYDIEKNRHELIDSSGNSISTYIYIHTDSNSKNPVVIFLHGGPFNRFYLDDMNEQTFFLYKLGYNIVELNYFGSEGLGSNYRNLAGQNLPEAALINVGTVIDWISTVPSMDKNNISVIGNSFGGYLSMLSKLRYPDKIKCAIAISPSSIYDIEAADIYEYQDTIKDSDNYDVINLLRKNPQKIGIIFNPLDPSLKVKINWKTISKSNPTLHIIDTFNKGHSASLVSFKKAVYYLVEQTNVKK
ncbi:S9 family peptidase [Fusibacter sp. 3D3]|uniref:alpha/beta hydrolase family protein n=1 Tax=Fusibacter sp. 3D3 TaxID=1048380 RepID=UPI000853BC43|nr:prolyl oligopeptidase family serine peptidase [Fusibacter sp. 3D3]GAU79430.1 hypothetical protein F3D3_4094 [Fusibacter sp. 3D3]